MITIRVDTKNKFAFSQLDPFGRLDILKLQGAFAIGSVDDSGEYDVPAALMVCMPEKDRLVVDWMYTLPEYRGQGLGSGLLILAFEEASARGFYDVAARISSEYDGEEGGWDPESFFVNDVFSEIEQDEQVFRTRVSLIEKRLREDEKKNKMSSDRKEVLSLSEISEADFKNVYVSLEKNYGKSFFYPLKTLIQGADPNVSILRIEGRECTGAVFVLKGDFTWYVLGLAPLDYEETEEIIRAALYRFEDYARPDDIIEIMLRRKAAKKALSLLDLPGEEMEICYYTATVSDFEKQKELMKEYEV